jgi:hypothetical protein
MVAGRTEAWGIPVLGNVECGHTHPMLTSPEDASISKEASGRRSQASRRSTCIGRLGHPVWQARALNAVGWYHALLGDHRRPSAPAGGLSPCNRGFGDRLGEADAWDNLGYVDQRLGH